MIDTKIQEVAKRRGFTNFWEAFDYMTIAGYSELDAMKIGLELFEGKIWDNVINTSWRTYNSNEIVFSSGYTSNISCFITNDGEFIAGIDTATAEPDDLAIEIYIMTKEGNPVYSPIYKSYIETRKYKEVPELEAHIKTIKFKLTTELAINLFKNGCKQIQ